MQIIAIPVWVYLPDPRDPDRFCVENSDHHFMCNPENQWKFITKTTLTVEAPDRDVLVNSCINALEEKMVHIDAQASSAKTQLVNAISKLLCLEAPREVDDDIPF
jgi:hypothetical protein